MKLKTYLKENNLTLGQFAAKMKEAGHKVSITSVWAWTTNGNNFKMPKKDHLRAIYRITKKAVKPEDFMD